MYEGSICSMKRKKLGVPHDAADILRIYLNIQNQVQQTDSTGSNHVRH